MNRKQMRLLRGLGVDFSFKDRLSNLKTNTGLIRDAAVNKVKSGLADYKDILVDQGKWKPLAVGAGLGTAVTYAILCLKKGMSYEEYKAECEANGETPISKVKYIALPKKKDLAHLFMGAGIGAGAGAIGDIMTSSYDFSIKDKLSGIGQGIKGFGKGVARVGKNFKEEYVDDGHWKSAAIGAGITTSLYYAILCLRNGLSYEEYKAKCEANGETPVSKAKYIALPKKKDILPLLGMAGRGAVIGGLTGSLLRDPKVAEVAEVAEEFSNAGLGMGIVAGGAIGGALANALKRKYDYEAYRIECERKGEKPIAKAQYMLLSAENLKGAALGAAVLAPTALAVQSDSVPVNIAGLGLSIIGLKLFKQAMRKQMKYSVYKAICEAKGEKPLSKDVYEDALKVGFIQKSL